MRVGWAVGADARCRHHMAAVVRTEERWQCTVGEGTARQALLEEARRGLRAES